MLLIAAYLVTDSVDEERRRSPVVRSGLHLPPWRRAFRRRCDSIVGLELAQEELKEAMDKVMEEEAQTGKVSASGRKTQDLEEKKERLRREISEAEGFQVITSSARTRKAILKAEQSVNRFNLWQTAQPGVKMHQLVAESLGFTSSTQVNRG
eukprot:Skav230772  [mRNA]  locus=scaffold1473:100062:108952:- [translate_table: standard]